MKPWVVRVGTVAALALVVVSVNAYIFAKERIKTEGERVYLELAPVDTRSLMQGDYGVALRDRQPHFDRGQRQRRAARGFARRRHT
jgi:hypothetical protein